MPGTVLGAWNITMNEKDKNSCLHGAYFLVFLSTCIGSLCVCTQSDPAVCSPLDYTLAGSSLPGILQARILEWVAVPPAGDLPSPGTEPKSLAPPALAGRFFTTSVIGEA